MVARPLTLRGAAGDANRSFGAHAGHLRCCGLRCSLTHPRMRALRYSAAPSSWTTWITESLGRPSGHTLALADDLPASVGLHQTGLDGRYLALQARPREDTCRVSALSH